MTIDGVVGIVGLAAVVIGVFVVLYAVWIKHIVVIIVGGFQCHVGVVVGVARVGEGEGVYYIHCALRVECEIVVLHSTLRAWWI